MGCEEGVVKIDRKSGITQETGKDRGGAASKIKHLLRGLYIRQQRFFSEAA